MFVWIRSEPTSGKFSACFLFKVPSVSFLPVSADFPYCQFFPFYCFWVVPIFPSALRLPVPWVRFVLWIFFFRLPYGFCFQAAFWNLQGCITVYLSRFICFSSAAWCLLISSATKLSIAPLERVVNNFFQFFFVFFAFYQKKPNLCGFSTLFFFDIWDNFLSSVNQKPRCKQRVSNLQRMSASIHLARCPRK